MPTVEIRETPSKGWHEFTSPDLPGFYMIAPDEKLEAAYDDIPRAIEMLYSARDMRVVVRLEKASKKTLVRRYAVEPT